MPVSTYSGLPGDRADDIYLPTSFGALAQLVERLVRNEKVSGSNPLCSISPCFLRHRPRVFPSLWLSADALTIDASFRKRILLDLRASVGLGMLIHPGVRGRVARRAWLHSRCLSIRRSMPHSYLPVLVFFVVALLVPLGSLALARMWMRGFTPVKHGRTKNDFYECGVEPLSAPQSRFHSQYYLFGLLFLIFDVETVFLLPFAVAFLDLSPSSFFIAMLFLLLLAEGLLWAWAKGFLAWRTPNRTQLVIHGD